MDRLAGTVRARPVRRRDRRDFRRPAVHLQGARAGGQQAVRAGVWQAQGRRDAVRQSDYRAAVEGQGRRGRVVKVGRIVPPRDGVLEQEICRAGSPYVRRVAVDCARLELERGAAADRHGCGKVYGDVDRLAGTVRARPVRRRDRRDFRRLAVHLQGACAGGKQAVRAGVGQREVRRDAVPQGGYRAAVGDQGRRGRVVKVGRIVAPRDGVREQEARRAVSRGVRRIAVDGARLELERGAAADRHGLGKVYGDVDRLAGTVRARPVRRRDRRDFRRPAVHLQGARAGGQQAVRAGVWQGEVRRGAVLRGDYGAAVEGQGRRGRVVKVGRIVAPRDGVREQEARRAVSRGVRRIAVDGARLELERGAAADRHGLGKVYGDVDRLAGTVRARPVRRRDCHHARLGRVDLDPALAAERGRRARRRQEGVGVVVDGASDIRVGKASRAADARRGHRLGDRAAWARRPQGVLAGVPEGVRPLAPFHHIAKHQRVGAVAVAVAGGSPRVEQQLERPRNQDGGVEPDVYVDLGAFPVRAVGGGGGGDVGHGRRRQSEQLDFIVMRIIRGGDGVSAASQVEQCDVGLDRELPREASGARRMLKMPRGLVGPYVEHPKIAYALERNVRAAGGAGADDVGILVGGVDGVSLAYAQGRPLPDWGSNQPLPPIHHVDQGVRYAA